MLAFRLCGKGEGLGAAMHHLFMSIFWLIYLKSWTFMLLFQECCTCLPSVRGEGAGDLALLPFIVTSLSFVFGRQLGHSSARHLSWHLGSIKFSELDLYLKLGYLINLSIKAFKYKLHWRIITPWPFPRSPFLQTFHTLHFEVIETFQSFVFE